MSETFFQRLEKRVQAVDSLVCVGLDPHPADLETVDAAGAEAFCRRLIELTRPYVAAYKPNAAFFEALGPDGWDLLQRLIADLREDVPVILDAKRGDIASTAKAYARSAFDTLKAGALTVNPYLGWDTVTPYLDRPEAGIFLLCRTSNPGAEAVQGLVLHPTEAIPVETLYERVASLIPRHKASDRVGLVLGATAPEALRNARDRAPNAWILAPGIGIQGGDLNGALEAGLRPDGMGILIHSSRGIARSPDPAEATRQLRDKIRSHIAERKRTAVTMESVDTTHDFLADRLFRADCVRFGQFTLRSGLVSPIYIDMRRIVGDPALLSRTAKAYTTILDKLHFKRLAAIPTAGLPIATAISLQLRCPMIFPRTQRKSHGTRAVVEGPYDAGDRVVMIDDLATRGTALLEALPALQQVGLEVEEAVVLVDRCSGAPELVAAKGIKLHALFQLDELLIRWRRAGLLDASKYEQTLNFLATSKPS